MVARYKYWLLLEKSSETRVSYGIDDYRDKTGEIYHYDNLVPNHKNLAAGDLVIIRKEDRILGIGRVSKIDKSNDIKTHRRCIGCSSTNIRWRETKEPEWKCGKCKLEFSDPTVDEKPVKSFEAHIEGFTKLLSLPTVQQVKQCALSRSGPSSQLSILELDGNKLKQVLDGLDINFSLSCNNTSQGFGLTHEERKAVEMRAMDVAKALYTSKGFEVIDKSRTEPYDLLAFKPNLNQEVYIEVKGTTGLGSKITLTHGEVKHAKEHPENTALVVVTNIELCNNNEPYSAVGGDIAIHEYPWKIDDDALLATQYKYVLVQP